MLTGNPDGVLRKILVVLDIALGRGAVLCHLGGVHSGMG